MPDECPPGFLDFAEFCPQTVRAISGNSAPAPMTDKIFAYCERGADPTFWAEPLNAASNAAFIAAGLAGLWLSRGGAERRPSAAGVALSLLVLGIGCGSFLFHAFAERWSALVDTIPIGVFMLAYLGLALRRLLGLSWGFTALGLSAFVGLIAAGMSVRCDGGACLNGSVGYLPALAALWLVGGAMARSGKPGGRLVLAGAAVFTVSLLFRTADRVLCDQLAIQGTRIGSHFLWHVLNACLLLILVRAVHASERTAR